MGARVARRTDLACQAARGAKTKYVVYYQSAGDAIEKAPIYAAEHRAHWRQFIDAGTLLMIGPFSDREGAMGIFTTRAAAEAFAAGDPFVRNGVVTSWQIREWLEAIAP